MLACASGCLLREGSALGRVRDRRWKVKVGVAGGASLLMTKRAWTRPRTRPGECKGTSKGAFMRATFLQPRPALRI